MRGVWGHASRPKLSSVRLPRYRANPASRGDAALNGFQLRPVTFNDAFSIFLAPFLAAATIVNLSWKEKQKKDWDNKLAEIDKEIEELRAREQAVLSRLQLSAATRLVSRRERRCYSTAAVAPLYEGNDVAGGSPYDLEPEQLPVADFSKTIQAALQEHATPYALATHPEGSAERAAIEDVPEAVWEVERLIVTRLALEMVVMAHLGGGPTAVFMGHSLPPPQEAESTHTASLLEHLQRVRQLESTATQRISRHSGFIPDYMDDASGHFMSLLRHLTHSYRDGKLTYVQLLEHISEALVNSRAPPTIRHYTALVKFLHDHLFTPYVPLVISAMSRSRLMLDETACERLLEHIGHTRDVKAFDWWLAEFTKVNSRLVSTQRWEWHRLCREKLPLPGSSDPRLIKTLTFTALSLGQISKAEAWYSVMLHDNYRGEAWADLIKIFLLHYTKQEDWTRGSAWIREVVEMATLADKDAFRSFTEFSTLVYRILRLCVECGKKSQYAEVLRAAIAANVKPPEIDLRKTGSIGERKPGTHGEKTLLAILSEWSWMIDTGPSGRNFTDEMRVTQFQEGLRSSEMYKELGSLAEDRNQSNQSSPAMQQANLDKLTEQLSESKHNLDQQLAEARKLQASLQTMLNEYVDKREDRDTKIHSNPQMPQDKRWEEQQSALILLQKELSRHRELIENEMRNRRQQQYQVHPQPSPIEDKPQDSQKIKQDSASLPSWEESEGLSQLTAVAQNDRMKKLGKKIAPKIEMAMGGAAHPPPSPSIYEPATDAGRDSSSGTPVYKLVSDIIDRPAAEIDSDSGYSSESSYSSHSGEVVNVDSTDRQPITKDFASRDEYGTFLRVRRFRGDPSGEGLDGTFQIPMYLGEGGCHRVNIDYDHGPTETVSPHQNFPEAEESPIENSLEATSNFFNTIDSIYPAEPPAVAEPVPDPTTGNSDLTVPAATTAERGSVPEPLHTEGQVDSRPADRRTARRLILDLEAELEETEKSGVPTQDSDPHGQEPRPVTETSKDKDGSATRISRRNKPQGRSQDRAKSPTLRIRKQKGYNDTSKARAKAQTSHEKYHNNNPIDYRQLALSMEQP